jgi:hypothetical protein
MRLFLLAFQSPPRLHHRLDDTIPTSNLKLKLADRPYFSLTSFASFPTLIDLVPFILNFAESSVNMSYQDQIFAGISKLDKVRASNDRTVP